MNLVWFRRDLRATDNPSLSNACQANTGVIGVYIATPKTWQSHNMGARQQQWIKQNLLSLQKQLNQLNVPLLILNTEYFSDVPSLLTKLVEQHKIQNVFFNYEYEWDERKRDTLVYKTLSAKNINVQGFHDQCLLAPDVIFNKQGKPYTVFTSYKKTCLAYLSTNPEYCHAHPQPIKQTNGNTVTSKDEWHIDDALISSQLRPGSSEAELQFKNFMIAPIGKYHDQRDFPDINGTSSLSPYFAIGAISSRMCIDTLLQQLNSSDIKQLCAKQGVAIWISELIWRDFYKMICYQYPRISRNEAFQKETDNIVWNNDPQHFEAWCQGKTGVPIVDAAMRQLNQNGWMHNRLRMVVAMYFTKNLWLDWRQGEAYFAEQLFDWDFSANNGGWQWSASTGTDAAPYFRVFNPISQSQRFDPNGDFIKRFCPELKSLNNKAIHYPFDSGIKVEGYPDPLVDLKLSRKLAIEAFKSFKKS